MPTVSVCVCVSGHLVSEQRNINSDHMPCVVRIVGVSALV